MKTIIVIFTSILIFRCTDKSIQLSDDTGDKGNEERGAAFQSGTPVYLSQAATWQIFYLPKHWIQRYLKALNPALAYVALLPPHTDDLGADYAPCMAPSRIVLGIVSKSGEVRERIASCLYYCESGDRPGNVYKDLWGSLTHLEGITVQILDTGPIDVIQHYRKRGFTPPDIEEDVDVVNKIQFEGNAKLRHHVVVPSDFIFYGKTAGPCIDMEEDH